MKHYDALNQARKTDEHVFTAEETESIRRLFSNWFKDYMRLREEAEEKYRNQKGLRKPTQDELNDVLHHRARPSDYPNVCFFYPQEIYGKSTNIYLRQIQAIFGDGSDYSDANHGNWRNLRSELGRDIPKSWNNVNGGTAGDSRQTGQDPRLQTPDGQGTGSPADEGGDKIPRP